MVTLPQPIDSADDASEKSGVKVMSPDIQKALTFNKKKHPSQDDDVGQNGVACVSHPRCQVVQIFTGHVAQVVHPGPGVVSCPEYTGTEDCGVGKKGGV